MTELPLSQLPVGETARVVGVYELRGVELCLRAREAEQVCVETDG